jgi:hypothetical protein
VDVGQIRKADSTPVITISPPMRLSAIPASGIEVSA